MNPSQIALISVVGVEPHVDTYHIKQLIDHCDRLLERGSGRIQRPSLSISPPLVVVRFEPVERYLHLPNAVSPDEAADIIGPTCPVRDHRGGVADTNFRAERLERPGRRIDEIDVEEWFAAIPVDVKAVFSRRCQTLSGPINYRWNVTFGESIAGSFLVAIVATKVAVLRRRKR